MGEMAILFFNVMFFIVKGENNREAIIVTFNGFELSIENESCLKSKVTASC